MAQSFQPQTLDELATEAVRLGRQVARDVRTLCIGKGLHEHSFARRCVARLETGQPFDQRDEGSIEALEGIIRGDLDRETLGHEKVFRGYKTWEGEAVGDVETIPRLTERGRRIAALHEIFKQFQRVRAAVLDRVAAERCLQRLMQD